MAKRVELEYLNQLDCQIYICSAGGCQLWIPRPHSDNKERIDVGFLLKKSIIQRGDTHTYKHIHSFVYTCTCTHMHTYTHNVLHIYFVFSLKKFVLLLFSLNYF